VVIVFEVSGPFQAKPGYHESRLSRRWWWLWFAFSVLKLPYKEWVETSKEWEYGSKG
jgi:hypothetical protein